MDDLPWQVLVVVGGMLGITMGFIGGICAGYVVAWARFSRRYEDALTGDKTP